LHSFAAVTLANAFIFIKSPSRYSAFVPIKSFPYKSIGSEIPFLNSKIAAFL